MSSPKTWPTVAAALGVVCTAVLVVLSRSTVAGVVLGVPAIICISAVYFASLSRRASAETQAPPAVSPVDGEGLARMVERMAEGEECDFSSLPEALAGALSNLAATLDGMREELDECRQRDPVTSLYTVQVFDSVLWREFNRAQRYEEAVSVALLEIEGLNEIRTGQGGQTADAVLKSVASGVLQMIRETDLAARYGEDEIAVIMPGTDRRGAEEFAQRFQRFLREGGIDMGGAEGGISVSIGAASVPEEGTKTAPELVQRAAEVLKRAKQADRSGV